MSAPSPHYSLTALNTLGLPARAAQYLRLDRFDQLADLPAHGRRFILGGGSNLVLAGDFDGLVLHVNLKGRRLVREDADAWYVEAAGGENWHDFVLWTLDNGWPGLENLVYIPGTVGAAPIQNIGAYGLEVCDRIEEVCAFDIDRGVAVRFTAADCAFAYRNSIFKRNGWHIEGRYLIASVLFRLPKAWQPNLRYGDIAAELESGRDSANPRSIAGAVMRVRQRKLPDPAQLPNAGSFFENPILDAATATRLAEVHPDLPRYPQPDGSVKVAAGWLIEHAGWKGRTLGTVGMYEKQALVLVNHGNASGSDVLALVQAVQSDVQRQFGIQLKPEPVILGGIG